MSTMSMRFPYKEKREGKKTKIGLTRLTHTPSNPYGSRAEACQPEPMISAARQGHGHGSSPRRATGENKGWLWIDFPVFRNVPIREEEEFLFSSLYRGEWVVPGLRYPHRLLSPHGHIFAMQHKQPGGVDMPQPYCQ